MAQVPEIDRPEVVRKAARATVRFLLDTETPGSIDLDKEIEIEYVGTTTMRDLLVDEQ